MAIVTLSSNTTITFSNVSGTLINTGLIKNKTTEYFPSNIRTKENVVELQESIGNLMANFRVAIDNTQLYVDITKIPDFLLDNLGSQFDLDFPKGVSTKKRRLQIRDAVYSYRTAGTERALLRIFKLIGWDVEVDQCWTTDDTTGGAPISQGEIIFGKEGYELDGHLYVDLYDDLNNTYDKITIHGEDYGNNKKGYMVKLPYIRITIKSQDYGDLTQDYVNPETGIPYSYTESEEFNIIRETIDFFLNEGRPANVAIFDLVTFKLLEDTIVAFPKDDVDITPGYTMAYDGTWSYGVELDPYEFGEFYNIPKYGEAVGIISTPPERIIEETYAVGASGIQSYISTRHDVDLRVELPSDTTTVTVEWSNSSRYDIADNNADWYELDNFNGIITGGVWVYSNLKYARAVRLNINTASTTTPIEFKVTEL